MALVCMFLAGIFVGVVLVCAAAVICNAAQEDL